MGNLLPGRLFSPLFILKKMFLPRIGAGRLFSFARISAAEKESPDSGAGSRQRTVADDLSARTELNRNADLLMRKFGDSILSFAYTYMQNRADAEEILQDSMIAYLLNAPVFANDAHARAWLLSTARNLCLNRLRYNRYRRHDDLDETLSERLAAPSKEDHSYLLEAVSRLPEAMRDSIYLFYWEGYSTSQIAVLLDRRENTVRSDLSRARKRLKEILKEEYDFD
jgi:RNA polymerase sigma-70 factor (ECF subfamily)